MTRKHLKAALRDKTCSTCGWNLVDSCALNIRSREEITTSSDWNTCLHWVAKKGQDLEEILIGSK